MVETVQIAVTMSIEIPTVMVGAIAIGTAVIIIRPNDRVAKAMRDGNK